MSGVLLLSSQYIHVLNQDTGKVSLVRGPRRVVLGSAEEQIGNIMNATVIREHQYAVISNPFDEETGEILMGQTRMCVGPAILFLNYKETVESVNNVHVLSANQAIRLRALKDHEDKKAGEVWQIKGPCRFAPNKYTQIVKTVNPISIYEKQGIYIIDTLTCEKKLIMGPATYLLGANEELYKRQYTEDECKALRIQNTSNHHARFIDLDRGQVVCIVDATRNERFLDGPASYILSPDETVKVLYLSAGVPKQQRAVCAAIIRLGPDFMYDSFEVRTKDNASLNLVLAYEWQFLIDPNEYALVFSMGDFIGYAATTLTSKVREEAAKHTFEEFHNNCADILHKAVFSETTVQFQGKQQKVYGLYFPENKFLVSQIDVKKFNPVNPEINQLLNESIKSNMIIFCNKMEQEATSKSEQEKIKTDVDLEVIRQKLIESQLENKRLDVIEKAKIDGQVRICTVKAQKESEDLESLSKMKLQKTRMEKEISLLNGAAGDRYLELLRVQNLATVPQEWYLASSSKLQLPLQGKQ